MPGYAHIPSIKRTHSPLRLQLPLQSNVPGAQNHANATSAARLNCVRKGSQFASPLALQNPLHAKTPTPSSNCDVPSSPNGTFASIQNNSDLSASSPVVDQGNPSVPHPTGDRQVPLQHRPQMPPSTAPTSAAQHPDQNQQHQNQSHPNQSQQQQQQQERAMSDEEQQLASKLKETYKNIVTFEEIVQKGCIELTIKINQGSMPPANSLLYEHAFLTVVPHVASVPSSTELSNDLWTIYHHNLTLLNNYQDFLITALKPSANTSQFRTGRNIVDLYKIPRRMWVYGIVGYLEMLKNMMSIFQDHEIFLCFIAYCYSVVSNLTDPALGMEGWWCEKLGDLSRMAIALYSSRFIDWKISAEHWYAVSMKTMYGHGKIYYHMCTVQQDNLDALVNIGKSVNCRDPFVPTQQYLRLVIENICTQRNVLSVLELPIIDFIKIHKVLLSIHPGQSRAFPNPEVPQSMEVANDPQILYCMDLVTRYGLTFGDDPQGYNFFTRSFGLANASQSRLAINSFNLFLQQLQENDQNINTLDALEKMNFWFNKGALFAIANINHLIGFGDSKNPFAKLFQLPEALRERKDKKERKRKLRSQGATAGEGSGDTTPSFMVSESPGGNSPLLLAAELSAVEWFLCLAHLNKSAMELSFRMLNAYLIGPKQASTCHVIVWLYFLLAVAKAANTVPNSKMMLFWLLRKYFPWEALITYLNALVDVVTNHPDLNALCCDYLANHAYPLADFNELEFLPEVWKCWGTLWFDVICLKQDYNDAEAVGILNYDLFDIPNCGTSSLINMANQSQHAKKKDTHELDNDQRLVRIILLARELADNYAYGIMRTEDGFRFDETLNRETQRNELINMVTKKDTTGVSQFLRDVFLSDKRLSQNNFIIPLSEDNIVDSDEHAIIDPEERDEQWFKFNFGEIWVEDPDYYRDRNAHDEENAAHTDSDMEENLTNFNQTIRTRAASNDMTNFMLPNDTPGQTLSLHGTIPGNFDEFYNAPYLAPADSTELQVEGDLGDRMDSSLTYITLDTNLWLKHCGKIFKCVRSKVVKVLIPLIIFQELRSLRKSAETTISDSAARSVIIIRELYLAREILPLRFDGTVASDINETTEFENNANWLSNVDLTMLNVVNEHDETSKKLLKGNNVALNGPKPLVLDSKSAKLFRYCILITDDRNMRLRAKTSGVTSFQSEWLFSQLENLSCDKCID